MKKYHPIDSRNHGLQSAERTPRPVRQFAAEPVSKRPAPTPWGETANQLEDELETKLEAIARKSESWLQLPLFGYLVSEIAPPEKRTAVSSKEWRNTILKLGAGLALYYLITTFAAQSFTPF